MIESMTQPSAPLMRRCDGTAMRDNVYEQITVDRSTGVAQAKNPPQSMGIFSGNDTTANTGMFTNTGASTMMNTDDLTDGEAISAMNEMRGAASDLSRARDE